MREDLYGKTLTQLAAVAAAEGLPPFAARQMALWLYRGDVTDIAGMTNLPKEARARLAERYEIRRSAPLRASQSADGTRKYLYGAQCGGFVEAAWIPEERRGTLCLSVQAGCKMGCVFCMTGRQGFQGQLSAGEILNQYRGLPERDGVTNIVYMGMGEPLDNLDNVLASLEVLTAEWGFGMSPTRVTVSTVGMLPALDRYLEATRCHLAVSLHDPFPEERRALMPIEKAHPLAEVLARLRAAMVRGQRRVSFEYVMFDGVNDTPRHARELARLISGIRCRVNLIAFHPAPGAALAPSPRAAIEAFETLLRDAGVPTFIRQSRGEDIEAACGMLSTLELVRGTAARPG
jgi:23S rRNA (adenine2503-C2)-methyltransferase